MLWIEESDKPVWHRIVRRESPGVFRAVCDWRLSPVHGRIWAQKAGELGPPPDNRCRTCVGAD